MVARARASAGTVASVVTSPPPTSSASARSTRSSMAAQRTVQQEPVLPDWTESDQIACSSFQPVAWSLVHVPVIVTWLPVLGADIQWLGMISVIREPPAALLFTPLSRPLYAASTLTLMWQSPSCSMCLDRTVPVMVRHGCAPSRTVCWPGRWRPCSGFDGQLPAGTGGGGHAVVFAVFVDIGEALPLASKAWTATV